MRQGWARLWIEEETAELGTTARARTTPACSAFCAAIAPLQDADASPHFCREIVRGGSARSLAASR